MKKLILWMISMMMGGVCHAEDITICYDGASVKVTQTRKDSVVVAVDRAYVDIKSKYKDHILTVRLTGSSNDGQLNLKADGKVRICLDNLTLTSQEGAPLFLKNKKKTEVVVPKGTESTLSIAACNDTVNHKGAVVWAKDKLLLSGEGTLNIVTKGDGCRGIKTKKDVTIEGLTLNVSTSGNNLGEKPFEMFAFPDMPEGGFPEFPGGFPMPNDSIMKEMFSKFADGGFPNFPGGFPIPNDSIMNGGGFPNFPGGFPMPNDSIMNGGGFPNFPGVFPNFGDREGNDSIEGGGFGGFGGKHKYYAATKGIASKGRVIINSGNVTVRTATAGAEGIEGKQGVIVNGGNVDVLATDDAINANATIEFNGGCVTARSMGNDAVDSNPKGGFFMPFGGNSEQASDPAIIIKGGTVYAWSQVGSPEEGLDCDFSPLAVEGGRVFTVGGGMGEMPSVPTNQTAKQPTVLLIGMNIAQDAPINICDGSGKTLDTITVPFSMRRSASIVSIPAFKVGGSYTVKTTDYERTFTIDENFTIVR